MPPSPTQPGIFPAARRHWRDVAQKNGVLAATRELLVALWEFLRDSTPSRQRQRYGDADYDWDYRVNTTSAAVGWRDRLLGVFHSPYQPTEPTLFHEMIAVLRQHTKVDFTDFTFLDLGCGKGRALLMASDYPFRRILGVELLPGLHQIAQQNLARYRSNSQKCFSVEAICADASTFPVPAGPLVVFLFNPLPESGLRQTLRNLESALRADPRPVYVLYHNPQLEHVVAEINALRKVAGTHQYSIFAAVRGG